MSDLVPTPVVENILSRLPLDSIARCRCVSKSWNAIITDPFFVAMHFKQTIENTNNLIKAMFLSWHKLYSLDCGTYDHKVSEVSHQFQFRRNDSVAFLGSCNGLVCLRSRGMKDMNIYVWNPYKGGQCVQIHITLAHQKSKHRVGYGFGYNAIAKDYQVVRVLSYCAGYRCSEVEVFSLRSMSWRRVQDAPYNIIPLCGKLVNGALHWTGKHYTKSLYSPNSPMLVLAYDMSRESFREVPMPNYKKINFYLETLHGYLCVNFYSHHSFVETWVMKNYGMKESWTKLFRIKKDSTSPVKATYDWVPLCFINKGSEVLLTNDGSFYLYDTINNCVQEIMIPPQEFNGITTYMESNVPVCC